MGRFVAILDRAIAFPESTGWPCPRDGDHDAFHHARTTRPPEAAAMEVPPSGDGGVESTTQSN
ncbi:hypothetical protein U2F26_20450 [Micromonospora sp. 4G57]|uniref:Uncharacterized protein n=1 Tax=Micromonospora sicca TaxID=2202420 RepID=A0ABU5JDZ2_9ACTN|nr:MULTISPECIES: hypothetical protein [unclassified Micromonospora]MDZ5445086.1 hypothetical protein [Micromonospora sp. 4G57]MDZ5490795.1 hypothetical protein [Micromonospora sp. 4G53]